MAKSRGDTISLHPNLPDAAMSLLRRLGEAFSSFRERPARRREIIEELALEVESSNMIREDLLTTRLFFELVDDLVSLGWGLEFDNDKLLAVPPDAAGALGDERVEVKERLRAPLVAARNEQLKEPATRRFIYAMERPRLYRGREVSVLDLLVSPQEMAKDLERRAASPPEIRDTLLDNVVDPYLQQATEQKDDFTGLRLIDVWRYCHYTWSLPLNSQPGRKMFYLVRDRARASHPIIGIGALGSSIVQITCRDNLIGWTLDSLYETDEPGESELRPLREPEGSCRLRALRAEMDQALEDIY